MKWMILIFVLILAGCQSMKSSVEVSTNTAFNTPEPQPVQLAACYRLELANR